MHYHSPETSDEVCKEIIWRNSHMKIDKNTILYKNWKVQNINFIHDILNEQGTLANKEEIERKHNIRIPQMEYNSLISAIPTKWKKILKEGNNCIDNVVSCEVKVKILDQYKNIVQLNTKDYYKAIIDNIA